MRFSVLSCIFGFSYSSSIEEKKQSTKLFDNELLAANYIIDTFRRNPRKDLEATISFKGCTFIVEVLAEKELGPIQSNKDRKKWYWVEHEQGSPSVAKVSFVEDQPILKEKEASIAGFITALQKVFFEVEMCETTQASYKNAGIQRNPIQPPASYRPLSFQSFIKPSNDIFQPGIHLARLIIREEGYIGKWGYLESINQDFWNKKND